MNASIRTMMTRTAAASANSVAVAVRCTGSKCDNMSYYTCTVN